MAQSFEDECFSDGDLDLLASHTINELENKALQSTQQAETEDQNARSKALQIRERVAAEKSAKESFPQDLGPEASSDYGLEDEDIIDLDLNQYAFSDLPQGPKAGLATRDAHGKPINKGTSAVEQRHQSGSGKQQSVSLASRPAQHTNSAPSANKSYSIRNQRKISRTPDVIESPYADATSKPSAPDLQSRISEVSFMAHHGKMAAYM